MADRKLCPPSPCHQNGSIGGAPPKRSPSPHRDGAPPPPPPTSPLRALRALRGLVSLVPGPSPDDSSRPRGQSLGSALTPRTRITTSRNKRRSSQQEEPEALLDLILESQAQRLEEQRASLSLLPDPGPPALCGACCPNQPPVPPLDLYYMLIHYQSDRMDDQRCSLPDLEDVVGSVPEGQEDFFSLVQRVQSRRMDEQRASLLLASSEDEQDAHTAGSSPRHLHHRH